MFKCYMCQYDHEHCTLRNDSVYLRTVIDKFFCHGKSHDVGVFLHIADARSLTVALDKNLYEMLRIRSRFRDLAPYSWNLEEEKIGQVCLSHN